MSMGTGCQSFALGVDQVAVAGIYGSCSMDVLSLMLFCF